MDLFDHEIGPEEVIQLHVRVNLEVLTIKGLIKALKQQPHQQMNFLGNYPSERDVISIFFVSQTGHVYIYIYIYIYISTLSIIRYRSRVKWSNPKKGVVPSLTPWCSSY